LGLDVSPHNSHNVWHYESFESFERLWQNITTIPNK
jgi:hypothetical protein